MESSQVHSEERMAQEAKVDSANDQKTSDLESMRQEKMPERINIYKRWCKSCNICVEFCPPHCLEVGEDGYPFLARPDKCIDCGWCEIRCPDFAITNNPRKKRVRSKES
ncbi:MAG: 4Fe-4S binding protein [Chloroflexota bacterium]|nr:4Fe-4S binding protein [Chloroflexota bacterium]